MKTMLEKYEAAGKLLPPMVKDAVLNGEIRFNWIDDGAFWYLCQTRNGSGRGKKFVKVDCRTGEKMPLFDHEALAKLLEAEAEDLPFDTVEYQAEEDAVTFRKDGKKYTFAGGELKEEEEKAADKKEALSPDGKYALFVKDYNLFSRNTETGEIRALTEDGEKFNDYARPGDAVAARTQFLFREIPEAPIAQWSPDSKKFITFRLDRRNVLEMPIVKSYEAEGETNIRPTLYTYRCPLPGDPDDKMPYAYFYLFDVESGKGQQLDALPVITGNAPFGPEWGCVQWFEDSSHAYFFSVNRGNHDAVMYLMDAATGECRPCVRDHADTFLNTSYCGEYNGYGKFSSSSYVTRDCKNVIWKSEIDGFFCLCWCDAKTGEYLHPITPAGRVCDRLIRVDEEKQLIYFMMNNFGAEEGISDPYYQLFCKVNFDGTGFEILTHEDADHRISMSPEGSYFIDDYSRVDLPPVTVLKACDGHVISEVEKADIEDLMKLGYIFPERFSVMSNDGKTTLYGILIKPADLEPGKKYPVIDHIYGGMHSSFVPKRFTWHGMQGREAFGGLMSYAQLGFAGVMLDGLGTFWRGKKIQEWSYKNVHGCADIADHVFCMKELQEKYPFLDIDNVGIWGNSAGGCATSRAMFEFADFYKVGVSSAGNHDQRMNNTFWSENYDDVYTKEVYDAGDNAALAGNLKGKLLVAHGALDDNVNMSQSIRLVHRLIQANKDFDMLIVPDIDHNIPSHKYFIRKKMDYFVKHLLHETPPAEYVFECYKE